MNLVILLIIILVLFGGGGVWSYGAMGPYAGGGIGIIGVILVLVLLFGGLGRF